MLLEQFNQQGLLLATSVIAATGTADHAAFRGDLVLKEGALREGSDRDRKPPEIVIHQAIVLTSGEQIVFASGLLYQLQHLPILLTKYAEYLSDDCLFVFYVENIEEAMQVEHQGLTIKCVPYRDGMVWNELLDLLYLEKGDLKGQSAEEKVETVFDAAKDFKIKAESLSYDEAIAMTIEVVKDLSFGPV